MMRDYNKINNILGWVAFFIAAITYLLTIEPTASWWDCGEYIATSYKLQVGHPPGAPLWQMLGRIFTLFAFGDTSKVALMINAMSAIASALTIMFLFWTITALARKIIVKDNENVKPENIWMIMGSGLLGALAYTFSDSFWFSAVEGEVYAMSSLFTALTFWAILKWERVADEPHSNRWLLFIVYLIGLSIGVHLLNLLAIPAVVLVYYTKKYNPTIKGIIISTVFSMMLVGFILYGVIPEVVNLFAKIEIFFVNQLGMPFNSGTIFFALLIIAILTLGIMFTQQEKNHKGLLYGLLLSLLILVVSLLAASSSTGNFFLRLVLLGIIGYGVYYFRERKPLLNTVLLSLTFLLIGYSSFIMIIVRSNADTPIDENSPEDAVSLLSYLNREQYGSKPLFYGQYYNAPTIDAEDMAPVYGKDEKKGKYVIVDHRKGLKRIYHPAFTTIFPRMHSNLSPEHIKGYKRWGKIEGRTVRVETPRGMQTLEKPTFGENLRFFFRYQLGHMYFRYFMWNFSGRQNNIESQGEIQHGNWITGIDFIDNARLGNQDNLPRSMQNSANNKFYLLPLIFGLIGLFYHVQKKPNDALAVVYLFLMMGVAIVVYSNQATNEPRERDYAYAGSFYAFAVWIGLSVMWFVHVLSNVIKNKSMNAIIVTLLSLILVPGIMAKEGWDDHDRSGKYAARDFAKNYLDACQKDAMLFTFGDNDTFPVWYAQEVEENRLDVRPINHMLASSDWYIQQLFRQAYKSKPVKFTIPYEDYGKGRNEVVFVYPQLKTEDHIELKKLIDFVKRNDNKLPQGEEEFSYFPTKKVKITVDKEKVLKNGIVPPYLADKIVPVIEWELQTNYVSKNDLMVLDLMATNDWERPVYTTSFSSLKNVLPIDKYFHLEGNVYKFMPIEAENYYPGMGGVHKEKSYDLLLNKYDWGRINEPDVVIDRETMRNSFLPKNNFIRVAEAFMEANQPDSAMNVADKCLEVFPFEKFPPDIFIIPLVRIYYEGGNMKKGDELLEEIASYFIENIDYISSLDKELVPLYEEMMRRSFSGLQKLTMFAEEFKREELQAKYDRILRERFELLSTII